MCDVCCEIVLREKLYGTNDYINCLDYIQQLLAGGDFEIADDKNEKQKNYFIVHKIRCKQCGEIFKFEADTFHNVGSFTKVE